MTILIISLLVRKLFHWSSLDKVRCRAMCCAVACYVKASFPDHIHLKLRWVWYGNKGAECSLCLNQ